MNRVPDPALGRVGVVAERVEADANEPADGGGGLDDGVVRCAYPSDPPKPPAVVGEALPSIRKKPMPSAASALLFAYWNMSNSTRRPVPGREGGVEKGESRLVPRIRRRACLVAADGVRRAARHVQARSSRAQTSVAAVRQANPLPAALHRRRSTRPPGCWHP